MTLFTTATVRKRRKYRFNLGIAYGVIAAGNSQRGRQQVTFQNFDMYEFLFFVTDWIFPSNSIEASSEEGKKEK